MRTGQQEFCTVVCFKFKCLGAVMCNASTVKNKHPAEAGCELRRVHNKFQLVKLIARCLLWILIPGRKLASTQSKDRWKLKTAKHLGSLGGKFTWEPSVDASPKEKGNTKKPLLLYRHSCAVITSSSCPQPSPVPSRTLRDFYKEGSFLRASMWICSERNSSHCDRTL